MLNNLLLVRFAWPSAFRGVRLIGDLLFWGPIGVLSAGLFVELAFSEADHDKHGHRTRIDRRFK